jgi:hypothetical protein
MSKLQLQSQIADCQSMIGSMPPPPPPMPSGGLPMVLPPLPTSIPRTAGGGLQADLFKNALKKRKKKRVVRTLEMELKELNGDLATGGFTYRCPNEAGLREAKKAAGLGGTKKVAAHYKTFKDQLFRALKLSAFDSVDVDRDEQRVFAVQVKTELLKLDGSIGQRELQDGSGPFSGYTVTFDDCIQWASRVSEREIYEFSERTLAVVIVKNLGGGSLGGLFPGEALQHSVAMIQGLGDAQMKARILEDREFIMGEFGRQIAQELQDYYPAQSAELTGSLLASSIQLERPPEDVDVNISTSGSETERTEAFLDCVEAVDGQTYTVMLPDIGQSVTIFPKKAIKVDGRVAEMYYAYSLNYIDNNSKLNFQASASVKGTLVPVDLEIKDVGGEEWTAHLAEGAEERTTNPDGTSKSSWLLADILNRILSFKDLMIEKLAEPDKENDEIAKLKGQARLDKWKELAFQDAQSQIDGKKLFQKLVSFGHMAMAEYNSADPHFEVMEWLEDNMDDSTDFVELFLIGCERDNAKFLKWFYTVP